MGILQVLNDAPVCLTDQTIISGNFDLNECPQILQLLQDVQDGSTSKNITCSQACVDLFNTVGESCRTKLISAFRTAKNPIISEYSNDFFGKCEAIQSEPSSASPVEAAPSPSTSEPPVVEVPSSMDQSNPVEAPATVPDVDPVEPPAESTTEAPSSGSKVRLYYFDGHKKSVHVFYVDVLF